MKIEKIKSITEAFSMQPEVLAVQPKTNYDKQIATEEKHPNLECYSRNIIAEILPETRRVDSDKQCNYYVGYNFRGEKLFEYLQSSVNVNYETTDL